MKQRNHTAALIALRRFGLGPRPDEWNSISSDPAAYLINQCAQPRQALLEHPALKSSAKNLQALYRFQQAKRQQRMSTANEMAPVNAMASSGDLKNPVQKIYLEEVRQRTKHAIQTDFPFLERLVQFWSNHFCVSVKKGGTLKCTAGSYEREAIRPHVLGSFRDMLQASISHPAMLLYLDNAQSLGPNSRVGKRRKNRGLNENLAREILELHTLGVDGGYSQTDVTNFARVLTGWSVAGPKASSPGTFRFDARKHEPGAFRILSRNFPEEGVGQGKAVLDSLSTHPATARHIAHKLIKHFYGNDAPSSLIQRIQDVFRNTRGDLMQVSIALVSDPLALRGDERKFLPPYDFAIAVARSMGLKGFGDLPNGEQLASRLLNLLGQPTWGVASPAGWPDEDDAWAAPDSLMERLDWSQRIVNVAKPPQDVIAYAESIFSDQLDPHVRLSLSRAESRRQAMTLLLMSPYFQRR